MRLGYDTIGGALLAHDLDPSLANYAPQILPANAVLVDVETTGLDAERHSIIEVAAVTGQGHVYANRFRARPGTELDINALAVNGATWQGLDVRDCSWTTGIADFGTWLAQAFPGQTRVKMAGVNPATLDAPMLNWAFRQIPGCELRCQARTIDLHSIMHPYLAALQLDCPEDLTSNAIYELLGMPPEPDPHTAIRGVVWEFAAFARIYRTFDQLASSLREEVAV